MEMGGRWVPRDSLSTVREGRSSSRAPWLRSTLCPCRGGALSGGRPFGRCTLGVAASLRARRCLRPGSSAPTMIPPFLQVRAALCQL